MRKSIPKPVLFGPDDRHGAWVWPSLKQYVWHAVWYEKGRRRQRSLSVAYGSDYKDAFTAFLTDWNAGAFTASKAPPAASARILITDALDEYLKTRGPHAASSRQLANRCVSLGAFFAGKYTDEITERLCRDYASTRAPGTARLELGTLSTALNYCINERLITWRPKVWRPREPVTNKDALTRDEAAQFLRALRALGGGGKHFLLAAVIAFYTAARMQSVLDLGWKPHKAGGHVDLRRGLIDFNALGRPQTVKERPIIPIPKKLLSHLRAAHKRGGAMVCTGRRGVVPQLRVVEKTFVRASIGLTKPVTPHVLCHTRISWLICEGAPIEKVALFSGRSIERINETYLHLAPASFKEIDNAI